ncbi:hypothetical protein AB0J82_06245 [Asanoa sp. NPDC049518]|uniref:hypothetical protein n=1 Tax=unclassified Asanoa TaxID=2685164 RepID=UPI003442FDFD
MSFRPAWLAHCNVIGLERQNLAVSHEHHSGEPVALVEHVSDVLSALIRNHLFRQPHAGREKDYKDDEKPCVSNKVRHVFLLLKSQGTEAGYSTIDAPGPNHLEEIK